MKRLLAVVVVGSALVACEGGGPAGPDLVDVLKADGRFTTLLRLVHEPAASRFEAFMSSDRHLTLFAPLDDAFDALPPGELEAIFADPEAIQLLLAHHLAETTLRLADLKAKARSDDPQLSVGGCCSVTLALELGQVRVNNATVVDGDIEASNGLIHVINQVIEFDSNL